MDRDNTKKQPAHLAFDLAQLQGFGSLIYPTVESALLELVARSCEAGATAVDIRLALGGTGKRTVILEDDVEMSDDQLESLADVSSPVAGNPIRSRVWHTSSLRKYGNLACFAIGKSVEVTTRRKGAGVASCVTVDLGKLEKLDRSRRAACAFDISRRKCGKEGHGTRIAITKVSPDLNINPATPDILAEHLAQRLIFADPDFVVTMSVDGVSRAPISNSSWRETVTRIMHWTFPDDHLLSGILHEQWEMVVGQVLVSGGPLSDSPPGIELYVDNCPVSKHGFFGAEVPEIFKSRTTGFLHVNFVSDHKGALKPGNPPTINWEHPEMKRLRGALCATVHNIYFVWMRYCEEVTSSLLGEEIESEWFRGLPFAKQSDLLTSLYEVDPRERVRVIDHTIRIIKRLVSPHPKREWRVLHKDITSNSKIMNHYNNKDYYEAVAECTKVYCEKVREISGTAQPSDSKLMESVFSGIQKGPGKIVLHTTAGKTNSENIQRGHRFFSQGLICGFKNPAISHGSQTKMAAHGLFTEDDCLDILSLVSYLFRCIENREHPPDQEQES